MSLLRTALGPLGCWLLEVWSREVFRVDDHLLVASELYKYIARHAGGVLFFFFCDTACDFCVLLNLDDL